MLLLLAIVAIDLNALAKNPGVAKVERVLPGEPAIIHVLDWHYVTKEALAKGEGLEGDKLEVEHAKLLQQATAVHKSKLILADVPEVFQEGLTDGNQKRVAAEILGLAGFHRTLKIFDPTDGEATRLILAEHQETLLRLGAGAELLMDGKPIKLLPAEGAEHEAGKVDKLGDATNKAREVAIFKRIVKGGNSAVLVLGGGHDLREAIKSHGGWGMCG